MINKNSLKLSKFSQEASTSSKEKNTYDLSLIQQERIGDFYF